MADCSGLSPSLEVAQRIAKFQMLSFIINSDAQMRKNTALLSNPEVGWAADGQGGELRCKLGCCTCRIHGAFHRVTFSVENGEGESTLMKRG